MLNFILPNQETTVFFTDDTCCALFTNVSLGKTGNLTVDLRCSDNSIFKLSEFKASTVSKSGEVVNLIRMLHPNDRYKYVTFQVQRDKVGMLQAIHLIGTDVLLRYDGKPSIFTETVKELFGSNDWNFLTQDAIFLRSNPVLTVIAYVAYSLLKRDESKSTTLWQTFVPPSTPS